MLHKKLKINTMRNISIFLGLAFLPLSAGAQVFMRPFDNAANLALGGAALATPNLENGLTHAAQLGQSPRVGAWAWSAVPYGIGGWQAHGAQVVARVDKRSGAGLTVLHSGIEGYREQRAELHYGRQLGPKWALGGTLQALRVSADEYGSATALTFAVSLLANPLRNVWVAAQVQNPAPQRLGDNTLSNVFRVSAAWQPSRTVLVISELEKKLEGAAQIKAGLEYHPTPLLRLRAGMRTQPTRAAFGAGLRLKNGLALDFGSEWHPTLGLTPAAMLGYRW
jgi:hypothetical protein